MTESLSPTPKTTLKRSHKRGHYDLETIYRIIDETPLAHIGLTMGDTPYVLPTLTWREDNRLYWHGSAASRPLKYLAEGHKVCITISQLNGWVMARSAFHHSVNFQSVVAYGTVVDDTDPDEKARQMKLMIDQLFPERWSQLRPMTAQEVKATRVQYIELSEASAKIRTGYPIDDAEDMETKVWAGVLPVQQTLLPPIPDPAMPNDQDYDLPFLARHPK